MSAHQANINCNIDYLTACISDDPAIRSRAFDMYRCALGISQPRTRIRIPLFVVFMFTIITHVSLC